MGEIIVIFICVIVAIIGFCNSLKARKEYLASLPEREKQQQELYENMKKEYLEYVNVVNKITKDNYNAEDMWDNLISEGNTAESIVAYAKSVYDNVIHIKKEYDEYVDEWWTPEDFEYPGGKEFIIDLKEKFAQKYEFDDNYLMSFYKAYKSIVGDLQIKKERCAVLKERGIEPDELSVAEEAFLIRSKRRIAEMESTIEKAEKQASEKRILSELENLRNMQEEQMEHLARYTNRNSNNIFG